MALVVSMRVDRNVCERGCERGSGASWYSVAAGTRQEWTSTVQATLGNANLERGRGSYGAMEVSHRGQVAAAGMGVFQHGLTFNL